jgi:uncharacterized protein with ParB-like and HNH nuclease domain
MEIVTEILRKCVEENANNALNKTEYEERYNTLAQRYESIKKGLEEINEKRLERSAKHETILAFMEELAQKEALMTEFDEALWNTVIEIVRVHSDHEITFMFKDNMELEWNI